ncbi:MAG: Cna B-type domain-containing protein, partial [Butyricicoccus sp.]|nr:Cna B-type domain-containing protein [Butyricicoccus sp.]
MTNTRAYTKSVTWHKEWKDDFAYGNDLRPDIYLDVYRVVHVKTTDGTVTRQLQEVMADLKWAAEDDSSWTVTLSGVPKYDSLGYEILYYAVEHTVAAAGDYDYQAAKYALDGTDLGTRDYPAKEALQGNQVVDLLDEDLWEGGKVPADLTNEIGLFEDGKSAQYALIENGTFTNTLADNYLIEGMKYWSSLPSGWPENRLPSVTFSVYQYTGETAPDRDSVKPADAIATLTVDDWTPLKSGLGYRYRIQYKGQNTLTVENGTLVCQGEGENPTPLPRYDPDGKLYHYLVVEQVNWDDKIPETDRVFTTTYTDFTVTNQYTPTTGSIRVKKHLYLPRGTDGEPEAYPAVTFSLTRQKRSDDGTAYVSDDTFAARTKVLSSSQVETLYENRYAASWNGYVTDTLTFEDLPLYAP